MKLICTINNLRRGVQNAEKIIGRNLTLPILSNVLLEAEKGILKISATNLEIGIIGRIRSKIEKEGKFAVSGRVLSSLLSQISGDEKINMEVKNSILHLSWQGNKTSVKGSEAKDFPLIPRPEGDHLISIRSSDFQKSLQKVLVCSALQDARQELTGVYCGFSREHLLFAATDSFRLAESRIKLEKGGVSEFYGKFIEKNKSIIIPAKTLSEITRSILPEHGNVNLFFGENQIFFEIDDTLYVSRLIDGKYPEYQQVVPKKFVSNIILKKESLLKAVRLASIFSDSKTREIKVRSGVGKNKIFIESQSVETGDNVTEVDSLVDAKEPGLISFNGRFLVDCVNSLEGESVSIGFNNDYGPVIFHEVNAAGEKNNENFYHVIMPIKN